MIFFLLLIKLSILDCFLVIRLFFLSVIFWLFFLVDYFLRIYFLEECEFVCGVKRIYNRKEKNRIGI